MNTPKTITLFYSFLNIFIKCALDHWATELVMNLRSNLEIYSNPKNRSTLNGIQGQESSEKQASLVPAFVPNLNWHIGASGMPNLP